MLSISSLKKQTNKKRWDKALPSTLQLLFCLRKNAMCPNTTKIWCSSIILAKCRWVSLEYLSNRWTTVTTSFHLQCLVCCVKANWTRHRIFFKNPSVLFCSVFSHVDWCFGDLENLRTFQCCFDSVKGERDRLSETNQRNKHSPYSAHTSTRTHTNTLS